MQHLFWRIELETEPILNGLLKHRNATAKIHDGNSSILYRLSKCFNHINFALSWSSVWQLWAQETPHRWRAPVVSSSLSDLLTRVKFEYFVWILQLQLEPSPEAATFESSCTTFRSRLPWRKLKKVDESKILKLNLRLKCTLWFTVL